jgi:hypothetical protein
MKRRRRRRKIPTFSGISKIRDLSKRKYVARFN